jgi:hypothetical protein
MAKFLIEVNEDGITHEEIVELLTGESDNEDLPDFLESDVLTVTRLKDETEVPEDAVYVEPEVVVDPEFPSDVTDSEDKK